MPSSYSRYDPTQRISQSDANAPVKSLFSFCLQTLHQYKSQIPLHQLDKELQKRIITAFCHNAKELMAIETFNEEYLREQYDADLDGSEDDQIPQEEFDWREATESRWEQFCRKYHYSDMDLRKAKSSDPHTPYRRLHLILEAKEMERNQMVQERMRERKMEEEASKNKTMKLVGNVQQKTKKRRAPSAAPPFSSSVTTTVTRRARTKKRAYSGASSSSRPQSALLKNAMKSATLSVQRSNPGLLSAQASNSVNSGGRRTVRRSVPKPQKSPPRKKSPPPKRKRHNPLPEHVLRDVNPQSLMQPHTPPPPRTTYPSKRRRINFQERRPNTSRSSFGVAAPSAGNRSTGQSLNAVFAPVNQNSRANAIKRQARRNYESRRFDENTKDYIREQKKKRDLNTMKIPKKSSM